MAPLAVNALFQASCATCGRPIPSHRETCSDKCRLLRWAARQRPLDFTPPAEPIPPANLSVDREARPRLQRKAKDVLEVLRMFPRAAGGVSNIALLKYGGARYGARIGEVRAFLRWLHGRGPDWDPIRVEQNKVTGYAVYFLEPEG